MCEYCFKPLTPKDEIWEQDMQRDAEEYMASLADREREEQEE